MRKRWILIFEDAGAVMSIYYDETEAMTAFDNAKLAGWNCHLFPSVKRNKGEVMNDKLFEFLSGVAFILIGIVAVGLTLFSVFFFLFGPGVLQ